MNIQTIVMLLLAGWIGYRIYLRVKRTFVWQRLSQKKLRTGVYIFGAVGLLFLLEGAFHPVSLVSDIVGLAAGALLAVAGAAFTRFERRDGLAHYRPSAWIGGAVTVLFLGRLAYRFYTVFATDGSAQHLGAAERLTAMGSGWTSGLMLIMFAYYVVYNALLMRRAAAEVV
ncbi:MAG: hypothetical protein J7639_29915 [Paenibacillaceae bacterium]|nr:hypothetical protein [Paenibacillaceae bacterium]